MSKKTVDVDEAKDVDAVLFHVDCTEAAADIRDGSQRADAIFRRLKQGDLLDLILGSTTDAIHYGAIEKELGHVAMPNFDFLKVFVPSSLKQIQTNSAEWTSLLRRLAEDIVVGVYVFGQVPSLLLLPNYDRSSRCKLPPAYVNTFTGTVLINVASAVSGIWRRCYFSPEKCRRFNSIWRSTVGLNVITGIAEGVVDHDYVWSNAGATDFNGDPALLEMEAGEPRLSPLSSHHDYMTNSATFFGPGVRLFLSNIQWTENSVFAEPAFDVEFFLGSTEDQMIWFEKNSAHVVHNQEAIRTCIHAHSDISHWFALAQWVVVLSHVMVVLKNKELIPNLDFLDSHVSSEQCRTPMEHPPLLKKSTNQLQQKVTMDHVFSVVSLSLCPWSGLHVVPVSLQAAPTWSNTDRLDLRLEPFAPAMVSAPGWFLELQKQIHQARILHRVPPEEHARDLIRRTLGHQVALQLRQPRQLLMASTVVVSLASTAALLRRDPSLVKMPDSFGRCSLHYAAMLDWPSLVAFLWNHTLNRTHEDMVNRLTSSPLHIACGSNASNTVRVLLALGADCMALDSRGCLPVHLAAACNSWACLQLLIKHCSDSVHVLTNNSRLTPLLLSAKLGALSSFVFLMEAGSALDTVDCHGFGVVALSSISGSNVVLKYIVEHGLPVAVMGPLLSMLTADSVELQLSAALSVALLARSFPTWFADTVPEAMLGALSLLLNSKHSQLLMYALEALHLASGSPSVLQGMVHAGAIPSLCGLVTSSNMEAVKKTLCLLSKVADLGMDFKLSIQDQGILPTLVGVLNDSQHAATGETLDVLTHICSNNPQAQQTLADLGYHQTLIRLLDDYQNTVQVESTTNSLSAFAHMNYVSQCLLTDAGLVSRLRTVMSLRVVACQRCVCQILIAVANNNEDTQAAIFASQVYKPIVQLLRSPDEPVRELAATCLWTIAGNELTRMKSLSELIGEFYLVSCLSATSPVLQLLAARALWAFCYESIPHQNKAVDSGLLPVLRYLLAQHPETEVLVAVLKLLGDMTLGVAFTSNTLIQEYLLPSGLMEQLLKTLECTRSLAIQIELVNTLGKVTLNNPTLQQFIMKRSTWFSDSLQAILDEGGDSSLLLDACFAASLFYYGRRADTGWVFVCDEQTAMQILNRIGSDDNRERDRCRKAFIRTIVGSVLEARTKLDNVTSGLISLVACFQSSARVVRCEAGRFTAAIFNLYPDYMEAALEAGMLPPLVQMALTPLQDVQQQAVVCLGQLTRNPTGHRLLLRKCRRNAALFENIQKHLGYASISKQFLEDWDEHCKLGLPDTRSPALSARLARLSQKGLKSGGDSQSKLSPAETGMRLLPLRQRSAPPSCCRPDCTEDQLAVFR